MIYLDNAATTYPKPEKVYYEMDQFMRKDCANPGRGSHKMALGSSKMVYETRVMLASLFGVSDPTQIIFTSNGTEAINIALKGVLKPKDHVITTSMEHNSVIRPLKALEKQGVELTLVQCDLEGKVDIKVLEKSILPHTKMIVCTHASNVTGTLMPIKEIGKIAKKNNIIFMVDGAQTAGVYPIDVIENHIDLLAFPGHKGLFGPPGIGGLYVSKNLMLETIKEGGTGSHSELLEQPLSFPERLESGTLNSLGIAGLRAGLQFIQEVGLQEIKRKEEKCMEYFMEEIQGISHIILYGPKDYKEKTSVLSLNFESIEASEVSYVLSEGYNIATRAGLHCAPLAHETIKTKQIGTIRISPGYFTKEEDIEKCIKALKDISKEIG